MVVGNRDKTFSPSCLPGKTWESRVVDDSGSKPRSWCMLLRVSYGAIMSAQEPREWTLEPESRTSLQGRQIQKRKGLPSAGLCRTAVQQRHLVVQMVKSNRGFCLSRSPCICSFKSRTKALGFLEKSKARY